MPARRVLATSLVALIIASLIAPVGVAAASVTSVSLAGGAGTANVAGTLFAKSGSLISVVVITSSDTKCVELQGPFNVRQTNAATQTTWSFLINAPAGEGLQTVPVRIGESFNANNCIQGVSMASASFVRDNTGPVVTGTVSPAPNSGGWNRANLTVTWSATDGVGSGVASGPTPATDSQSTETATTTKTATATDRVGNTGSGSVVVKLDKTAPSIGGSRNPAANANGWNNTNVTVSFTCSDALAGIKACSGPTVLSGSSAGQSVTGSATDNADNIASATVGGINIDKVAPLLSGSPTTSPNGAGWYRDDVTIDWTASDALSGLDGGVPADSTISSEGTDLTAVASVSDKAGNSTTATSSPAVRIDRTPPTTTASAVDAWNNTSVTIQLDASDALSGVASTHYELDGGATQSGTSVTVSGEGVHSLRFWSVDVAGNDEDPTTIEVRIDQTPPTITHTQDPEPNANGWNRTDVTVTFECDDALSGIASCTGPQTISTEGEEQPVTGTAEDNAGNTATDPATVSIDKTDPTIDADRDRAPNANGWYDDDVFVSFTCGDALSGIDVCPTTITVGEGADQSASGTAKDAAGNTATDTVDDLDVDKTKPELTGAATTDPNAYGWYRTDVTIHWTASDALSGLDGPAPADETVTGEGDNLSASASVTDLAGNTRNTNVTGIRIDRTAPTTSASVPDPLASGWYAGGVLVTLATGPDLSGIETTWYRVDGGGAQAYSGPFTHSQGGIHTISFWSVDNAGNVEDETADGHTITLRIDDVAPTITGSRLPAGNAFGWSNTDVIVSFLCEDAESGLESCTEPVTLVDEGADQAVDGTAVDNAGNSASDTVSDIDIDKTAPSLSGAATTSPNANDWYRADVTIHWSATDALSGIDASTVPADALVTGEGDNLGAGPVSVFDKAGNTSSASVSGIRIDRTAPVTTASVPDPYPSGWYASGVTVTLDVTDALSGVDATWYAVDDGDPVAYTGSFVHGLGGTHTITYWSVDDAGNEETPGAVEIKIDDIDPTISGSRTPLGNPFGWNNTDVTVSFVCDDAESGVASCTGPVTLTSEGAGQSATGTAVDDAGNSASTTVSGINVDRTVPAVSLVGGPADGSSHVFGSVPAAPTCAASDALSGLDGTCAVSGYGTAVGSHTVTAAANDRAGNGASASSTYTVSAWTLLGFYQPVDMNGTLNTVKGGSTVPLKFEVFAGGTERTSVADIQTFKSKTVSCAAITTGLTDEIELTTTGGTNLRYDSSGGQFIQNWQTPKGAGICYQVTMTTIDGSSISAWFKTK